MTMPKTSLMGIGSNVRFLITSHPERYSTCNLHSRTPTHTHTHKGAEAHTRLPNSDVSN